MHSTWGLMSILGMICVLLHDDVMIWKYFLHYWPFGQGIQWLLVDSQHKGPVMQSFESLLDVKLISCLISSAFASDSRCLDTHVMSPLFRGIAWTKETIRGWKSFQYKVHLSMYRYSHYKDKTIMIRISFAKSYTWKNYLCVEMVFWWYRKKR